MYISNILTARDSHTSENIKHKIILTVLRSEVLLLEGQTLCYRQGKHKGGHLFSHLWFQPRGKRGYFQGRTIQPWAISGPCNKTAKRSVLQPQFQGLFCLLIIYLKTLPERHFFSSLETAIVMLISICMYFVCVLIKCCHYKI